ncbi:Sin3 histone deacetylase corepressor complex component SDS3 [Willisornis vidua]|uniref:Sin3 histone deacetylase corepressor complex component SDS3 n=1 Tax=Willisornis vidua TaxID=1566151 RepID=A0ABQ9DP65_9PASS|nr:Sin3 histone deacetylase corepressor complex component SDS3 [Willisornis vidua]
MPPAPDYYEEEELESAEEEDGERSARARDSDEDTEDASETDLAKHDEEDFVEMKEQMYQDKLASLKRQLQQLQEDQVEKNYVKEKKAAAKEFEDKKIELKENLIAELEEKKKMIENEKLTMELTGASPSSPEHLPATPAESPAQRFEARIEDGKLYYDKRWYHKSQAIYLEAKDNTKISCVISSVGANEIWVRKTSDSTKMRIYLGQLQRGVFVIRRRSAA